MAYGQDVYIYEFEVLSHRKQEGSPMMVIFISRIPTVTKLKSFTVTIKNLFLPNQNYDLAFR